MQREASNLNCADLNYLMGPKMLIFAETHLQSILKQPHKTPVAAAVTECYFRIWWWFQYGWSGIGIQILPVLLPYAHLTYCNSWLSFKIWYLKFLFLFFSPPPASAGTFHSHCFQRVMHESMKKHEILIIILLMYRICYDLSLFPAQCRQDGSPGGIRSCSRAADASEFPSDGWGLPGSGIASPTIPGGPAADHDPPSSVPSSCSPQHRRAWERNESQRERGQSCPEVRWRSSQPPPLRPLQIGHPIPFTQQMQIAVQMMSRRRFGADQWAWGLSVKQRKRKVECERARGENHKQRSGFCAVASGAGNYTAF